MSDLFGTVRLLIFDPPVALKALLKEMTPPNGVKTLELYDY